jgi:hypothetical protein
MALTVNILTVLVREANTQQSLQETLGDELVSIWPQLHHPHGIAIAPRDETSK